MKSARSTTVIFSLGLSLQLLGFLPMAAQAAGESCTDLLKAKLAAGPVIERNTIEFTDQRAVYVESRIQNSESPVLVFLPGIYRGIKQGDGIYQALEQSQQNWVALHYSSHPESILTSKSNPMANPKLGDLANEISLVLKAMHIKKYTIVSLSYSGAVSAQMHTTVNGLIIESAPMGKYNEEMGTGAASQDAWNEYGDWFTGGMYGYMKEAAYRNYWTEVVAGQRLQDNRLADPLLFNKVINGYVGLAKASEGYDIKKVSWQDEKARVFFLAENEMPDRLQSQKIGILNYIAQTQKMPFIGFFEQGEHNLSTSHPVAYLKLIAQLNQGKIPAGKFGAFISAQGKITWLTAEQAMQIIE